MRESHNSIAMGYLQTVYVDRCTIPHATVYKLHVYMYTALYCYVIDTSKITYFTVSHNDRL